MNSPANKNPIPEAILRFITKHHVLTLATTDARGVWCSNCFYAFDKVRGCLIFTSGPETRHAQQMEASPEVAASIVLETRIVGRVQGLQLCGHVEKGGEEARKCYLKRFPYAAVSDLHLWELHPATLKLTDNTLGFGKKLLWNR